MAEGCGHDVAPGARYCGACGAEVDPAGDPDAGTVSPSTPWPTAPRRSGREVSIDKAPTVAVGLTTPFAAPPIPAPSPAPAPAPAPAPGADGSSAGATTAPPSSPYPVGPPGPGPAAAVSAVDRRTPLILGVLVLVLVVAVLALSFEVMSSNDDPATDRAASPGTAAGDRTTVPTTAAPVPSTTAAPVATSSAPAVPATEPAPPASAPSTTERTPTPPVALADELVAALDGYIAALDLGDIDGAYAYIAVSLRGQDGWDVDTFTTFWTESVVGAAVVSVDAVSASRGTVHATVDYGLPDGATSREDVVATFAPAGDAGLLVMTDYEVLDSERID